jgi:hypothetical protein
MLVVMTWCIRDSLITTPPPFQISVPKSQLQPLNVRDRPSILCLAPHLVVPNSPNQNHGEDQDGPIEILGVGVGRDGEEHEDEQRSLERKGTEVSRKQKSAKRAMVRRQQYFLIGKREETHAKLQNRPKRLPKSNRECGIGSPENRRDTMQPMHSM